jgi:hypothetical protein
MRKRAGLAGFFEVALGDGVVGVEVEDYFEEAGGFGVFAFAEGDDGEV